VESIKASSKGQMIIHKEIREALDIRSGTQLLVELEPGKGFKVTLKPGDHAAQARRLAGCLARYAKGPASAQSDDSAILRTLAGDDARIRAYAKRKPR